MLSLRLDASSAEGAPWRASTAGFAAGPNLVAPFRHPAIEDFALVSHDRLLVVVRERCAGEARPERAAGIRCGGLAAVRPDEWRHVAAAARSWPLHWVTLTIHGRGPEMAMELETGEWGTAPLFAVARDRKLWVDWDPAALSPVIDGARLDVVRAAHFLAAFDTSYSSETLLREMVMQTERSRMSWRPGPHADPAIDVTYPEPVPPPMPRRLVDGADPPEAFWRILTSSVRRWLDGYAGDVVAEVSGGLDSAVVAAAATAVSPARPRSCGIALAGPARDDQRGRRRIVAESLGLDRYEVDILDHLPFAPGSCRVNGRIAVPWEECYYEAVDAMLGGVADTNGTLVLTGLGGDELCGRRPGERPGGDRSREAVASPWLQVPPFLAACTREAYRDTAGRLERAPRPLAAASVPECIAIGSAMYMRRGVWAVHPLATPQLIRFCAQLPREWRRGRRVQRELLTRLGFPARLTYPRVRDDFMPALAATFRGPARPLARGLFAEPRLAELGLVDRDRLLAHYDAWCADGEDIDGAMPLYAVTVLELGVRAWS